MYVPRQLHHINAEMEAVKRASDFLEMKDFGVCEILEYLNSSKCREQKSSSEFLRKIKEVKQGTKVVLDDHYVNEQLGGVADLVKNRTDLFNSVEVD